MDPQRWDSYHVHMVPIITSQALAGWDLIFMGWGPAPGWARLGRLAVPGRWLRTRGEAIQSAERRSDLRRPRAAWRALRIFCFFSLWSPHLAQQHFFRMAWLHMFFCCPVIARITCILHTSMFITCMCVWALSKYVSKKVMWCNVIVRQAQANVK